MTHTIAYKKIPYGHSEFFLRLIHNGCEKIKKCFSVRFDNPNTEDNFSPHKQGYFIVTLKELIEREEYFGKRWAQMDNGVPYDFDALKEFIRTNPTIHRLETQFGVNVLRQDPVCEESLGGNQTGEAAPEDTGIIGDVAEDSE